MTREAVATWFGAFVLEDGKLLRRYPSPLSAPALQERVLARRAGRLTEEEELLIRDSAGSRLLTRDRRLAEHGLEFDPTVPGVVVPGEVGVDPGLLRDPLLASSEIALRESWDPSIHLQEAVRALTDLDRMLNLIGERLGSWASRDRPDVDPGEHAAAARALLDPGSPAGELSAPDPAIGAARRSIAETYRSIEAARQELERALRAEVPLRIPNLSALLGAELAAKLVAQAGGLERLSRLPAGTIQVLGAERAFFEHLRGRASSPRHGLLFLHPRIQGAPRPQRGKLARALAGKAAIAARLDRAGSPVNPTLLPAFETRAAAIRALPAPRSGRRGALRPPLHRAAQDR